MALNHGFRGSGGEASLDLRKSIHRLRVEASSSFFFANAGSFKEELDALAS